MILDEEYVSEEIVNEEELHVNIYRTHQLYLTGTLLNPCCDFNFHYVKFPDTPCGSYSTVQVNLQFHGKQIINCHCGYLTKIYENKKKLCNDTTVHFRIYGNNPAFSIEPSCGYLHTTDVRDYFGS